MKALIIDDERLARKELASLLEKHEGIEIVGEAANADEAETLIAEKRPDLLFLDINMPGRTGFELLESLDHAPQVIFVTAYDEHALKAFQVNALDYLLKPIEEEELARSVAKFHALTKAAPAAPDIDRLLTAIDARTPRHRDRFLIKLGSRLLPVATRDIAWFISQDGTTELITREGRRHLLDQPLDEIEAQLDPAHFFRLNRQCIACIECIAVVHQHFNGKLKVELRPATPMEVMVSREKARAFKDWLDGVR